MSTIPETPTAPPSALLQSQVSLSTGDYVRGYIQRIRAGDLGAIPIIFGIIVISIIFQSLSPFFLTPHNFVNLILQMSAYTMIAYGVVFVLLLGEIDLSVGYVSAIVGVSVVLMLRPPTAIPWFVAIPAGLVIAALIGAIHGMIISIFQLPSFVVTLAALLVWSGAVLLIIGNGGTIILQDATTIALTNTYLPPNVAWLLGILFIAAIAVSTFLSYRARQARKLATPPIPIAVARIVLLALFTFAVIYIANLDGESARGIARGVPVIGIILLLTLFFLTYVTQNTRFGRYIYAIGGNKEAARRAGISVERYRVIVFMISSVMAGTGGIILAARSRSVATDAGGGNLVLDSIAAAVIGGTSLFGGRGNVSSAVLGAIIIAGVENGMDLIPNISSGDKYIVTGLVLLLAVIIDAISRRIQKRSGLT